MCVCVSDPGSRRPLPWPLPSAQGKESSLEGKQQKSYEEAAYFEPREIRHFLPDIMCDLVHDLAARAGFVRDFSGLVVSFPK